MTNHDEGIDDGIAQNPGVAHRRRRIRNAHETAVKGEGAIRKNRPEEKTPRIAMARAETVLRPALSTHTPTLMRDLLGVTASRASAGPLPESTQTPCIPPMPTDVSTLALVSADSWVSLPS